MKKRWYFLALFLSMTVAYAGSGGNGGEGGGSLFFGGKGGKGGNGPDSGGAGGKGGRGFVKNGQDGENGKCTKAGLEYIQTESQDPEQNECSSKETENGEDGGGP